MASGDKTYIDSEKYGVLIRDYTDEEKQMAHEWIKRNKVKRERAKREPKFPNNKMFIKGY